MVAHSDARGRRIPTAAAMAALDSVPGGYWMLPDPLNGQPLIRLPADPAEVRVLLDRCAESARADEPTQDYLAVRCDPRRLTFAVTDGVGSSFLGDVAAQILAVHLADWLAARPPDDGQPFDAALDTFLRGLSDKVARRVEQWPLPDTISDLVRSALDQQRAYGSEAMFACGAVDLTGSRGATLTIAWLGDAHVRLLTRDGHYLDHRGQTTDRWSTRLGPRGTVRALTVAAADVARVIACTDGLESELDAITNQPDVELSARLAQHAARARSDDMALVDIAVMPRAMPGVEANAGTASTLWQRLTEQPRGRHARANQTGSAIRRLLRAVGPSTATPSTATPSTAANEIPSAGGPAAISLGAPSSPMPTRSTERDQRVATASTSPTVDRPSADPPPVAAIGAPDDVSWRESGHNREIAWSPVPGADSYTVHLCREPTFLDPLLYSLPGPGFTPPNLPGPVFIRVRGLVDGVPGPWSETLAGPP